MFSIVLPMIYWSALPMHWTIVYRVCYPPSHLSILIYSTQHLLLGYDLCSAYDTTVPAKGKCLVKTDLSIAIPLNTYARIAPRSGLAVKNFIDTGAGVVDYDYRGPVGEFKAELVALLST